jgi:hypothetical protein
VRARVVAGDVATELSRAANDADLLAVGRPHHRRWLRRSIGDRCAYLFDGPVILVPADHRAGGDVYDGGLASTSCAFDARSSDANLAERN